MCGRIVFDSDQLNTEYQEEIVGQNEFTFWTIVSGIFGDLKDLSEMINNTDISYVEMA